MLIQSFPRMLLLALACALPALGASEPDWVAKGANPARYPADTHLTGFAMFKGGSDPLGSAKGQAAADLAARITVRIESALRDEQEQKGDKYSQQVGSLTRTSTDVRLTGLTYETYMDGDRAWALAVLPRAAAAADRRRQRDQSIADTKAHLDSAQQAEADKKPSVALKEFYAARVSVAEAASHEQLARAIAAAGDPAATQLLTDLKKKATDGATALLGRPAATVREAIETLAQQLRQQGVVPGLRWTVTPLTYGTTTFSSVFGRQVGLDLDRSLATAVEGQEGAPSTDLNLVLGGNYIEGKQELRLAVWAREVKSGRAVAGAESAVPRSAVPEELPFVPQNLMQALRDQKILAVGEEVSGDLRVELWTNKGRSNLAFSEKDELKLHLRVNRPAYIRLVYLLAGGQKVPISQSYYLDATKVNLDVEYPDAFEITRPFGVEHVQAVAFTEKPEPLPTVKQKVDGEDYDVVEDTNALVKHRGFKAKAAKAQTAEAVVEISTTPRL